MDAKMGKGGKALVVGLFLFFLAAQVSVSLARAEFFPFSWEGVFAGRITGESVGLTSFVFAREDGEEIPYEKTVFFPTLAAYGDRLSDEFVRDRRLDGDRRFLLSQIADELLGSYRDITGFDPATRGFVEFRIYFSYWRHFTGPRLRTPDERHLLLRRRLHD